MKEFLKYLGVVIEIIGALILIIPAFAKTSTNASMLTAGILLVVGLITQIVINKVVVK